MCRYLSMVLIPGVLAVSSPLARGYPAKPVRILVPSAPGGGYDFVGRLLAERFSEELGEAFIVENRTGAGTLVGTQAAAAAPADGYTLLVGGLANMAFNPALYKDARYNPTTDFVPIALVGSFTYALVTRKDLPQSSLKELVEFARKNPSKLTIAHAGIGTGQHVAAVALKRLANIDLLEIAYKGAQPAYTDLLAGRVDLFFDNTTTTRPFVVDGRVKPIVTSGSQRDPVLPDVPTCKEAGLDGLVLDSWIGLFAPAKTPRPIIEQLRSAAAKALESAGTRKRMEASGWRVLSLPPAETESFIRSEAKKWGHFLQQAGIRAE
jgi:tripartite-type tricarboxylate transporter receptor subunit TctC